MAIAIELGVDRKTVRAARERLGVASMPAGRRRGVPATPLAPRRVHPADERYEHDRERGRPATKELLAAQVRALHEALLEQDDLLIDDALAAISSIAKRILDHRQKVRRAS